MYGAVMTFGKHRGKELTGLPTSYLKWLLESCDSLDHWLRQEVRTALAKRGAQYVPADEVLNDLEEEATARCSEDPVLSHFIAGRVTDHLLDAFQAVRRKHNIGVGADLVIDPRHKVKETA